MILKLAYYGDPILRKKAARIEHIDDELRQFVNDMHESLMKYDGVGLAAPQVHRSIALFLTNAPKEGPDDTWLPGTLRVFINPKILSVSEDTGFHSEGCLSIPKLYLDIERPIHIKVEYTTIDGERRTDDFSGYEARVIMHENDHINGVLFIDRIKGKERKEIEPILRKIKSKHDSFAKVPPASEATHSHDSI